MATRTAVGTPVTDKTASTTLTISSAALNSGDFLIVGIGSNGAIAPASVKWGARDLTKVGQRIDTVNNIVTTVWAARYVRDTATRDIVATWTTGPNAKAMVASKLDSGHVRDEIARSLNALTTAPSVGPTAEHLRRDDFVFGYLVAEGPDLNDTAPTVSSMATGQRIGTAGLPQTSNITINEYYLQSTTSGGVTLSGTLATERNWCNVLVAFKVAQGYCVDINGSVIEVGDTVIYLPNSTEYVVSSVDPLRNSIELTTIGSVSAVECEVIA